MPSVDGTGRLRQRYALQSKDDGPKTCGSSSFLRAEKSLHPRCTIEFPQARNGEASPGKDFFSSSELFPAKKWTIGPLHCAILRQLHSLSPAALSAAQLAVLLRGRGYLVLRRDLIRFAEELAEKFHLERQLAIDGQVLYRLLERPWTDDEGEGHGKS
ncbi:MAG: hypothetical protein LBH53_02140 [Puniceicoccales bacterium]|jgi:hypothetical protein|nr:hypothetical protein [Puniceicoccales bacterium]